MFDELIALSPHFAQYLPANQPVDARSVFLATFISCVNISDSFRLQNAGDPPTIVAILEKLSNMLS